MGRPAADRCAERGRRAAARLAGGAIPRRNPQNVVDAARYWYNAGSASSVIKPPSKQQEILISIKYSSFVKRLRQPSCIATLERCGGAQKASKVLIVSLLCPAPDHRDQRGDPPGDGARGPIMRGLRPRKCRNAPGVGSDHALMRHVGPTVRGGGTGFRHPLPTGLLCGGLLHGVEFSRNVEGDGTGVKISLGSGKRRSTSAAADGFSTDRPLVCDARPTAAATTADKKTTLLVMVTIDPIPLAPWMGTLVPTR